MYKGIKMTNLIEVAKNPSYKTNHIMKTISVAIFVSLASRLSFEIITDGFIVAFSVVVMAIFIYCYNDLSPAFIAMLSGVFSPMLRIFLLYLERGNIEDSLSSAMPDVAFFFSYALFYTFIYKWIILDPKSMKNFPFAIFFCDALSNIFEMTCRSILAEHMLVNVQVLLYLVIIALIRTGFIMFIIVAIEAYSSFLLQMEHDEEYKKLLTQASIFESELRLMEKNAAGIEDIMKKAYDLHKSSQGRTDIPENYKSAFLDIAREAHEVKGDYISAIDMLRETYSGVVSDEGMKMSDIIALERANAFSIIRKNNLKIEISLKLQCDFMVIDSFPMMSIIRNLLTNAVEAIGRKPGTIQVQLYLEKKDNVAENYIIKVRDDGNGIAENELDSVFIQFYSTKFNPETGNIQRGIGLSLVKDYVEEIFGGRVCVESEPEKFAEFTIVIPAKREEVIA